MTSTHTKAAAALMLLCAVGCAGPNHYTLLLETVSGADHILRARQVEDTLVADGWKNVFIITKGVKSEVYWDKYPTPAAAESNLQRARTYRDRLGGRRFTHAMVVPLPGKAAGPPEWNLLNAPGLYTIQVAVFFDVPEENNFGREDLAVELCGEWRKRGHEAYYYHGPVRSHVTVGAFGASAVRTVSQRGSARREIVDPRITEFIREYPELLVNNAAYRTLTTFRKPGSRLGEQRWVRAKPFLVEIPRRGGQHVPGPATGSGHGQRQQGARDAWHTGGPAPQRDGPGGLRRLR